jgi:ketosteroid isomerase-like protein
MSQENLALVQRFEDAWTRRDLDAALQCIDDDFEIDWSNSIGPFVGSYKGFEGLTQFWSELREVFDDFSPRAEDHIPCGNDRLITLDLVRATGKGSGIEMTAHGAMLWTVREGKIRSAKMFQNRDDALAAVQPLEQERP